MTVLHVVGARPNFIKTAPIMREMERRAPQFEQVLIHTGQHYDDDMSKVFFEQLDMPKPDEFLKVGSGTHAQQTAAVMLAFEPVVLKYKPDWVFVVGDVNSTVACALVCAKLGIRVAHVEAGLRSWDRTMPEEINRVLTDQICELLLTPSIDANDNLLREGVAPEKIHFVGNVMIDSLVKMLPAAQQCSAGAQLGLKPQGYVLVTLHRPFNVDSPDALREILAALVRISHNVPVVFPVHPRTRQRICDLGFSAPNILLDGPKGYIPFLSLLNSARMVLTDSGGVQEESTFLGVPCLTVRPNTERPVTISCGTNRLVGASSDEITDAFRTALLLGARNGHSNKKPDLWDGHAANRIVDVMQQICCSDSHGSTAPLSDANGASSLQRD